ncbi:hypothetical protein PR048_008804 [Dryococelus australis]|uniref:Uncharacterized protein n=1 Tax=Dryococelus australis TaxID=614101 RepID=A0ABQ9HY55_9NEOP|nr:hypothetical protein PR048_008804 [Dryococelus australis]
MLQYDEVSVCEATVEKNVDAFDALVLNANVCNGQEVEEIRRPLNINNISIPNTSGFSPEIVHIFAKARKRNGNFCRRLKGRKTAIFTDTL